MSPEVSLPTVMYGIEALRFIRWMREVRVGSDHLGLREDQEMEPIGRSRTQATGLCISTESDRSCRPKNTNPKDAEKKGRETNEHSNSRKWNESSTCNGDLYSGHSSRKHPRIQQQPAKDFRRSPASGISGQHPIAWCVAANCP